MAVSLYALKLSSPLRELLVTGEIDGRVLSFPFSLILIHRGLLLFLLKHSMQTYWLSLS